MAELWAVGGDRSDHGGGYLRVEGEKTVKIEYIPVVTHLTKADGDNAGHLEPATWTMADSHSKTVFAYKKPAHRNNDKRNCGAKTEVIGQSTVKIG